MSADRYGPLVSRWKVAQGLKDDLEAWMPEYVAAYERQNTDTEGHAIEPGSTIVPQSYTVRHAAMIRAGEQLPALVIWVVGTTDKLVDPDGTMWGTLELGVFVVASSNDIATTGDLLHRHTAAVSALLLDRPTCGGLARDLEPIDEDFTRIDPERERTLVAADLRYAAHGVLLGQRGAGPPSDADPRPDPHQPWPPVPTVATADVDVRAEIIDPED
jgi:hypothetical protein